MQPIISVQNLGKRYLIGHKLAQSERYVALRDVIARGVKDVARKTVEAFRGQQILQGEVVEEFWALKDISFEVKRGEVLGIIGRNGAGKSTLLKILSRITEPTTGRVVLDGRVASLLEVGTGFHPELTGRENIFLNGAILGMTRAEIRKKFDEIVEFSGVAKFLDTPVKRYSSGMYVRLAFAVAAHLEPEILIIDEVLAVGDVEFQKKCLGKMQDVAQGGRTVLFVSHNLGAVKQLCSRALHLESGHLLADSSNISDLISSYLSKQSRESIIVNADVNNKKPHISSVRLDKSACNYGETIAIQASLVSPYETSVAIEIEIHDEKATPIIYTSTAPMMGSLIELKPLVERNIELRIGPLNLASGRYLVYLWLIKPWQENFHILATPLEFSIVMSDPYGTGFQFKQAYARGCSTCGLKIYDRCSPISETR